MASYMESTLSMELMIVHVYFKVRRLRCPSHAHPPATLPMHAASCPHACSSAYGHALHTPTLPQQAHLHPHPPIHPHAPHAHPSVPPCMQIHLAHEASFALGFIFFFFLLYFNDEYGEKENLYLIVEKPQNFGYFFKFFLR